MSVDDQIDDGFTAEERAQFDAMRTETSQPPAPQGDEGAGDGAADGAGATEGAAAGDGQGEGAGAGEGAAAAAGDDLGEGDDDHDDGDGAAAAGAGTGQQPAPKLGADGKPIAETRTPRRVSYSRYKRLEDEAKELRAKLGEKDVNYAKVEERLKIINEALTATTPAKPTAEEAEAAAEAEAAKADPMPDPEADLFAYNAWLLREMDRREARADKRIEELQHGRQQDVGEREFTNAYLSDSQEFAAKEPNFVPAYQFLMASRMVELAEYYFGKDLLAEGAQLTPQETKQIREAVAAEERQLAETALAAKQSPAQRIFNLARARGYRPAAPAAAAGNGASTGKGAAAAAAGGAAANAKPAAAPGSLAGGEAPPARKPSVTEEIERIRTGAEASLSLSDAGGSPGSSPLTAERLAKMNDDEFAAVVDRLSPKEWEKLAGGGRL